MPNFSCRKQERALLKSRIFKVNKAATAEHTLSLDPPGFSRRICPTKFGRLLKDGSLYLLKNAYYWSNGLKKSDVYN